MIVFGGINMRDKTRRKDRGFTLIELMVVIVILGILAGLIIPRIMGRPDEARRAKARIQIESLGTALKLYKLDNGNYPTTEQGLQGLVEAPAGGQLAKKKLEGGRLSGRKQGAQGSLGSGFCLYQPRFAR